MFFPEKILSIKETDRVLEIGPGSLPYHRSDVFLELNINDENEAKAQRGYADKLVTDKPIVYYDGKNFPFKDNEFDYVICSHVIEHIPLSEIENFISELKRISKKGYIEFPNIFYELINYQNVHLSLMNCKNNTIMFLDKSAFTSNYIHKIYREMFYGSDKYLKNLFTRYKELFFIGFEWNNDINYKIVKNFEELVDEYDYYKYKLYFSTSNRSRNKKNTKNKVSKFIKEIKRGIRKTKLLIQSRIFLLEDKRLNYSVHKTAQLDKKELINIKPYAEIKDYVIIRTYKEPVYIGEYAQINPFTVVYGGSGVYIGNNVMIGPNCVIAAGDHDYKQIKKPMRFAGNLSKGPIVIEDNVWIGANCTITDGVRIGKEALIGANTVVTKDVQPYDIVAGTPARVIGNRIDLNRGSK